MATFTRSKVVGLYVVRRLASNKYEYQAIIKVNGKERRFKIEAKNRSEAIDIAGDCC